MMALFTNTWSARGSRDEAGFTMLELLIVIILLGIASASIFPAIFSMGHSTTRSTALSQAQGEVKIGARLLERDIRGAAGDRSMGNRTDLDTNPRASVIQALNSATSGLHDVLLATSTRLTINSEAMSSVPGIERIAWDLRQNNVVCGDRDSRLNRNWCVVRTISSSAGAVLSSEVVVRGRGAYPATSTCYPGATTMVRLFCYRLNENARYGWNTGWTPTMCRQTWRDLNTTFGTAGWVNNVRHNGFTPAVRLHQTDLIITIGIVLPAGGGYGQTSERVIQTVEVTPRSRQGEAYQQAIMCGDR
ncbi:MAG: hypothetical protein JWM90_1623 [Thermoleophilia bacterium]|nr:hypothetical protein [Thermoleophilia bacterium]